MFAGMNPLRYLISLTFWICSDSVVFFVLILSQDKGGHSRLLTRTYKSVTLI
jgi:hypothetical protein